MVYLIEILRSELPEVILLSYEGDYDLFRSFHLKETNLHEAVNLELELIDERAKEMPFIYMKVIFEEKVIGYIVKSGRFLYSFAIGIKYRTKEILIMWWTSLKRDMGNNFTCALMNNNTRAINYMKARGMKILSEDDEKVFLTN